jgi:hypothetical protein
MRCLPYEGEITSYVMENSPEVISIGYRTEVLGYAFLMLPHSNEALLIPPSTTIDWKKDLNDFVNKRIKKGKKSQISTLVLEDHVPYLYEPDISHHYCCLAPVAKAPASATPGVQASKDAAPEEQTPDAPKRGQVARKLAPAHEPAAQGGAEAPPAPAGEDAEAYAEARVSKEARLRASARSIEHMMTHEPKNPFCEVCERCRIQRQPRRRGTLNMGEKPTVFGQQTTGDHFIRQRRLPGSSSKDEDDGETLFHEDFPGASTGVVFFDRATTALYVYPKCTKSTEDTLEACRMFEGPTKPVKSFYSDNSPELLSASKHMKWSHATSTPGIPQRNGLAERMVRKVEEGARCGIVQSGFSPHWWIYSGPHYCMSHNTREIDGKTPYASRQK